MGSRTSRKHPQVSPQISKEIDRFLKSDWEKQLTEIKILLLGAGESGKSTIFKQMKILHLNGFDQEEKLKYKSLVYSNTIESLNVILKAMHSLQIPFALSHTKLELEKFLSINFTNIDEQVAEIMKNIWLDNGTQECFSRSNEYQLSDSAK
jgi:hypothetical protein